MYYNIDDALSYNALFTMVMGGRGIGKTYSAKKRAIKNFLNKGEQFVYMRRYKSELKKISTFFSDIAKEYPEHEFKSSAKGFFIDDKQAGFVMTLSTQVIEKSTAYPDVSLIIFEEFLIDPASNYHYLRNEVETFLEAYSTVSRDRDVRALFLANNISMYNPYFLYFGLHLADGETRCRVKDGDIILLKVSSEDFANHMFQTRFGRIVAGTSYGDYAIGNVSLRDDTEFLEKKQGTAYYYYGFYYGGDFYGVWRDDKLGLMYCSEDYDPSYPKKYTLSMSDHSPNTLMVRSARNEPVWRLATIIFKQGKMRFESGKAKSAWIGVMRMLNEIRV